MTLKLIEIRGTNAYSRPLTPEESEHMLSVRNKLQNVHDALPINTNLGGSIADVHHLVYLANRETFGRGHHDNATHKTPLIIVDGEARHKLAFEAFGYDAQNIRSEILPRKTKPNRITITEDKLTTENAHNLITKLAKISDVQIHRIGSEIDFEQLQLNGWDARIEMYELQDQAKHRLKVVRRGGIQGKIDAWVILRKLKTKKKENM